MKGRRSADGGEDLYILYTRFSEDINVWAWTITCFHCRIFLNKHIAFMSYFPSPQEGIM
jgi:hypothetical protein